MSPRIGRTGGSAARGFGRGTAVRGPRGIPSVVSATAVGTVENASDGRLNLVWSNNGDATSVTRIYNGASLLFTSTAGATTYSVTGLNANTAYTLTVKHYKDSIESAGSNFSQATTYQYNGHFISAAQGTNNNTAGGYSWSGSGYDKISTYANGNNGTYNTCVVGDQLSTDYVQSRVTSPAPSGADVSGTYTVPSGVTSIKVFICAPAGRNAGDGTGGGGGGGAVWGLTITGVASGDTFHYDLGAAGNGTSSQFYKTSSPSASPSMANPGAYCLPGGDGSSGAGGSGGDARDPASGTYSNGVSSGGGRTPQTTPVGAASYGGGAGSDTNAAVSGYSVGYLFGQDPANFGAILAIVENP